MKRLRLIGRWLCSRAVRRAAVRYRQVKHLLRSQQDLLPATGVGEVRAALAEVRRWSITRDRPALAQAVDDLNAVAARWLVDTWRKQPRETFDMLLVALAVILSVRTFFCAPMRIPTGSMQPTLDGVRVTNLRHQPGVPIPHGWRRWVDWWVFGQRYVHIVAKTGGRLGIVEPPEPIFPFLRAVHSLQKQRFQVGDTWYTLWFPPTELQPFGPVPHNDLFLLYTGVDPKHWYRPGEDIIRAVVTSGDHILVDRLTYNFRRPERGEIIVFNNDGLPHEHGHSYYMKRLIGLPGDRIQIGNDRHLIINGHRQTKKTPHFEQIYSFHGPPRDSAYSGYLNDFEAHRLGFPRGAIAPKFPNQNTVLTVRPGHCFVLGDNTVSSYDGRHWGDFPLDKIVGRAWLDYWPNSDRLGWIDD